MRNMAQSSKTIPLDGPHNRGLVWHAYINSSSVNIDELLAFGDMGGFAPYPYTPALIVGSLARHHPDHVPLWFIFGATVAQLDGRKLCGTYKSFALPCIFATAGCKTALIALMIIILHHTYKIRMSPLLMLFGIPIFSFSK